MLAAWRLGAVFEAPAFVAGLDDVAVVREAVQQGRSHFGISENARPFAKGEIGCDDERGAFVEPADEVEEELAAGLGEGEIAEFVENDEVHAGEIIGDAALASGARLGFEPVDEINGGEEASAIAGADATSGDGDRQVSLARAGSAYKHAVALLGDEAAAGEGADKRLVDRRVLEYEVVDVLGERQLGDAQLVLDRARLLLGDLRFQEVAD